MDNEILEGDVPVAKKRASRKTETTKPRAPRKPRAKKEIQESYSASPDGLTCEYSNTVQLEAVEDWSPANSSEKSEPAPKEDNHSKTSAKTETPAGEEVSQPAAQSERRYRRYQSAAENTNNSETSTGEEVSQPAASNERRYRRYQPAAENINNSETPAEGEISQPAASNERRYRRYQSAAENTNNLDTPAGEEISQPAASNERNYRRFQRLPRVAEQGENMKPKSTESGTSAENNSAEYNRSRNDNFRNNVRGPQQNNSLRNANRRRVGGTIRIGAFSIGYLRNLECLENSAKLSEFCQSVADESREPLNLNEVLEKSNDDLADFASSIDLDEASSRGKIIDNCIESAAKELRPVVVRGILESMEGGDGIITYGCDNYKIRAKSTFVPRCLIQTLGLRRGQTITAYVHSPMEQSTCPFAVKIIDVLGRAPEEAAKFPRFKDLTPYYPTERIFLEQSGDTSGNNLSMRVVDLLSPIGFGQRGLIVAPPRTGKTILLQGIANSIIHNQPKAKLIVLLIDERPEEVTDFTRQVKGAQVVSSTFDESAESHVHAAEIVIENARRWVEAGEHVIILLDSITRLARAYNTEQPSSGKVLSGGVEANALQLPKRFFGSARNIEGGGSLTIIATALIETGSRMDDVIFEEFKGTGNMELHLDRSISDKRIFPAINIELSGTRKEELLYHPDELVKIYSLRRAFQGVPPVDAMEMLSTRLKKFATNVEFLMNLNR